MKPAVCRNKQLIFIEDGKYILDYFLFPPFLLLPFIYIILDTDRQTQDTSVSLFQIFLIGF